MWFQTFKMAAISWGQGNLMSNSRTRCPWPLAMFLPNFVGITRIDCYKSAKILFLKFKMAAISRNLEQLRPHFALHSRITQHMCLQNIIGISAKLRVLGPNQIFHYSINTFWILLMRRQQLQTNQTHIGPTLHVGPKYHPGPNSHIYRLLSMYL